MTSASKTVQNVACVILLSVMAISAQDPNFHIYLGFGQSNMAGAGTIETQDKTVDSRFQMMAPQDCPSLNRSIGKWYPAVPPLWGCPNGGLGPCDYFGRTMVKNQLTNIKVGVVVVGIPGCDIRLFDKNSPQNLEAYTYGYIPAKYNKSAYAWLLDLAKLAQKEGVIKGFLMHQGETMPDSTKWCGRVKAVYDSLILDLKLDPAKTPLLAGELLYNKSASVHNIYVDSLPKFIPNCYVISAAGLAGKDEYHFNAAAERTFGARYADTMLSLLATGTVSDANTITSNSAGYSKIRPVSYARGAVQIKLTGDFSYRITTVRGSLIKEGRGSDAVSVGYDGAPGVYCVSVTAATGLFTEKIFRK